MGVDRILVTGASGSGTSTLGRAVADDAHFDFIDLDDFYWLPTHPPYRHKRAVDERRALVSAALTERCVVAGSAANWGREIENTFDLIVFLWVPAEVRVDRLRRREQAELGFVDEDFLVWPGQYDEGLLPGRSRSIHEQWLAERSCPVMRITGVVDLADSLQHVRSAIDDGSEPRRVPPD